MLHRNDQLIVTVVQDAVLSICQNFRYPADAWGNYRTSAGTRLQDDEGGIFGPPCTEYQCFGAAEYAPDVARLQCWTRWVTQSGFDVEYGSVKVKSWPIFGERFSPCTHHTIGPFVESDGSNVDEVDSFPLGLGIAKPFVFQAMSDDFYMPQTVCHRLGRQMLAGCNTGLNMTVPVQGFLVSFCGRRSGLWVLFSPDRRWPEGGGDGLVQSVQFVR